MRRALCSGLFAWILLLLLLSASCASPTEIPAVGAAQGIQVFRFGVVDWSGESVTTKGQAPLLSSSSRDRVLAKRGALTDARRNLLCLLYEIRHGLPEKITSIEVEGEVAGGQVDFNGVKNGVYTVEVTMPLKRFFAETRLVRVEVR